MLWMHLFPFSLWKYQSCVLFSLCLFSRLFCFLHLSLFSLNCLFFCLFFSVLTDSGQCTHFWMSGPSKLIGICMCEHSLSIGGSHHGGTRLQFRVFVLLVVCVYRAEVHLKLSPFGHVFSGEFFFFFFIFSPSTSFWGFIIWLQAFWKWGWEAGKKPLHLALWGPELLYLELVEKLIWVKTIRYLKSIKLFWRVRQAQ